MGQAPGLSRRHSATSREQCVLAAGTEFFSRRGRSRSRPLVLFLNTTWGATKATVVTATSEGRRSHFWRAVLGDTAPRDGGSIYARVGERNRPIYLKRDCPRGKMHGRRLRRRRPADTRADPPPSSSPKPYPLLPIQVIDRAALLRLPTAQVANISTQRTRATACTPPLVRAESGELTERRTSSEAASVSPRDLEHEPAVFSTRIELEPCAVGKCPGAASTAHAADRSLPGESWDATDGSLGKCAVRHKHASAFLQAGRTEPPRRGARIMSTAPAPLAGGHS
jgi:hypothetical protein